jgi:hypothetical protein
MGLSILVVVCAAILFYRAAVYERMAGWVWAIMSLAISAILVLLSQGIGVLILGQVGLYVVMWWYNAHRHAKTNTSD